MPAKCSAGFCPAAVGFLELEPDGVGGFVSSEWLSGEIPSLAGRHRVVAYGSGRIAILKTGEPFVVENVDEHPLTRASESRDAFRMLGVRAFMETPLVRGGDLRGWLYVSSVRTRTWRPSEIALAKETLDRTWETLERARAEERLREREARLEAVLEQMPVGVILANIPDGDLFLYNRRSAAIMGHDMLGSELSGYATYGGVHEDGTPYRADEYPTARAVLHREIVVAEPLRYLRPDGTLAYLSVSAAPIYSPYGDFAVCTFQDQTELHEAVEREKLLNAELAHRVKNLLATVQAIASNTIIAVEDRQSFESRLQALAAAQDLVAQKTWEGSLEELVRRVTSPFGFEGRIAVEGPPVMLHARQTTPFALAVHELVTNALKYGALSNDTGRVGVSWTSNATGMLHLEWREGGGPTVLTPTRRGFGSRLLERGLASVLDGSVTLQFTQSGLICTMTGRLLDAGVG